ALGRVFLQGPGLVVLDEASSRLDPAPERRAQRAAAPLPGRGGGGGKGAPSGAAGERTGIVIAHRLATLERVDDVLILEGGRVVEWGPRLALAGDPGSRLARPLRLRAPG